LQPCRLSAKSSGTAPTNCADTTNIGDILDFTYGFSRGVSNNGNVASIANNRVPDRSQFFTYDELNRLATARTQATAGPHCWGETFSGVYPERSRGDIWANLLSIGAITPTYNGCTQESLTVAVTSVNQVSGYTYDAAGNLTNAPGMGQLQLGCRVADEDHRRRDVHL
jgi:hypothetical protein